MYVVMDQSLFILFLIIFLVQIFLSLYFYLRWKNTTKKILEELKSLKFKVGE